MTLPLESRLRQSEDELAALAAAGPPGGVREVLWLAYPVILTQLSMTTMGVVDSIMVGRLGKSALAAVGFGGVWTWTIFCFFIGTSNAVQTFVSQCHGAGQPERCGAWTWQGFHALVPITALVALTLGLTVGPLLELLAPSESLRPLAAQYIAIRALGAIGMCAANVFAAFFRGIGDTRTPLYVTLFANALNVVLDYGLIFGRLGLPQWGVAGAATATAIAEWTWAGVILWLFTRPRTSRPYRTALRRPSGPSLRRLLRTGLPIGGQWLLEMLSFAVFLTLVARMGDASMAASQAFIALLSLSFMQASGIAIGVSTLVGRYVGADDHAAAERSFRSAQLLAAALSGAIALLFLTLPGPLMRLFSDDPAVLALGRPLLAIGAIFQLFDCFSIVADGALRGAGDTRVPFLARFALAWGLFVPLSWWLGVHLEGGLTAAWLSGAIYVIALTIYLVWRFRSGAWREIRI